MRIDHRRVADGIHAAGDADLDLPERDLVADEDRRLEARAAGALHVEARASAHRGRYDSTLSRTRL